MNTLQIIALIFMAGAIGYIVYKIDQNGFNRCNAGYINAANELRDSSDEQIVTIQENTNKRIQEVYNAPPSDDDLVAPVLQRTLDGMRQRHKATSSE